MTGPPDRLKLTVELEASDPPAGRARLDNAGSASVQVWASGNSWGDGALSFILDDAVLRRGLPRYTRNAPAALTIERGRSIAIGFDLGDPGWRMPKGPHRLIAVYEIPPSPEATAHGVWTGRIQSAPVEVQGAEP